MTSQDRSVKAEIERLIAEMREAVVTADRPYPIAIFHESLTKWADRLSALIPQVQKEQGDTRVDWQTVTPSERATAAENQTIRALNELHATLDRLARTDADRALVGQCFGALASAAIAMRTTPKAIVHGYDATFWHGSYMLLSEAVLEHLPQFVQDDDVAEEAILVAAIEKAGHALALASPRSAPATAEEQK